MKKYKVTYCYQIEHFNIDLEGISFFKTDKEIKDLKKYFEEQLNNMGKTKIKFLSYLEIKGKQK